MAPTAETISNPMVEYLNSLRTQEEGSNASYVHELRAKFLKGLRTAHAWFPDDAQLHVPTKLDGLAEAMRNREALGADLIFLTGDAGDGKTALCDLLAPILAGGPVRLRSETLAGEWLIVKDASEIGESRLKDLIRARLDQATSSGLLVAINEGRLRRVMRSNSELWDHVIEPSLRTLFSNDAAQELDAAMRRHRLLVLNFRQRFHVRSVLPALLLRWTDPSLWEQSPACGACTQAASCPILANTVALRDAEPQRWLSDVLANAHFSGQRLPFRRLQALLALACTGGLHCEDVQNGAFEGGDSSLRALRHRYYEVIFPPSGPDAAEIRREVLCNTLAPIDPGLQVDRAIDSRILDLVAPVAPNPASPDLQGHPLPELEASAVGAARVRHTEEGSQDEAISVLTSLTRSLRRWFAVTGTANRSRPPRWLKAQQLLERYTRDGQGSELMARIIEALNLLHGPEWKPNRLLRNQADPAGFRDPDRLALELDLKTEFDARLVHGPIVPESVARWLESEPSDVVLTFWPAERSDKVASLQVDARFVEALLAVCDGYTGLGGLGPFRRDLSRFFGKLGQLAHSVAGPPSVSIMIEGRRTRVSAVGAPGSARLSFNTDA